VALEAEAARSERAQVGRAGVDIVDAIAHPAAEMMMVVFSRHFVAARRAGEQDLREPLLFDERLDVAIDRRDADARNVLLRDLESLERREGPVGALERVADRGALLGIPLHRTILARRAPGDFRREVPRTPIGCAETGESHMRIDFELGRLRRIRIAAAIFLAFVMLPSASRAAAAGEDPEPRLRGATDRQRSGIDADLLSGLAPRSIGPAGMSGRVAAIAAVESNPDIVYAGAATGGVWKSENGGMTWRPIFDDQPVAAIGAIAIHRRNPAIVWVGTGEGNVRNSASVGNGVYRSVDGGESWTHLGLDGSERIHRIVLHPDDPEIAWVAALGREWGENPERGIFKTLDGGRTWRRVLYVDERTGGADVAMVEGSPNRLLASMWQYRRWPYSFKSGGPGSGLYTSQDGGESWQRLEPEDGLPEGDLGRIGLGLSRSHPEIVYAMVEAGKSALLRSEDGGRTFKTVNAEPNVNPRPFYFCELRVDPQDPNRVYSVDYTVRVSADGGKSFATLVRWEEIHGDHHALWIDPANPRHLITGNDGGISVSHDGGKSNRFVSNLPLAQFYHVAYDNDVPYNVYGGLQDNGSWRGPSSVNQGGGIRNHFWKAVGGGDGFETLPDPTDSLQGYAMWQGGNLFRWNWRSGEAKDIKPAPPEGTQLRFNWNAGLALDPFDPRTVLLGSQFLHRSTDRGETWTIASPDLTTNTAEWQKAGESGGLTRDASNAENHTTIVTIEPSRVQRGLIWVGSDDGRLHVTRDGGASWASVEKNVPGVPANTWIPAVHASTHGAQTAFAVFDNHRRSDWTPYVYRTDDFGKSWRSLATPALRGYALAIVQDPVDPELLFLGTEFGLWLSLDGGRQWTRWSNGFPTVSVMDLAIHPRESDLIIATHGRALWIVDDISPLRGLGAAAFAERLRLFPVSDTALRWQLPEDGGFGFGATEFRGASRPYGAAIRFLASGDALPIADPERDRERRIEKRRQEGARSALDEAPLTAGSTPRAESGKKPVAVAESAAAGSGPAEKGSAQAAEAQAAKANAAKATLEIFDASGRRVRRLEVDAKRGINRVVWDLSRDAFRRPPAEKPVEPDFNPSGPQVPPGSYEAVVKLGGEERRTAVRVLPDPTSENSAEDWRARWEVVLDAGRLNDAAVEAIERIRATRRDLDAVAERIRAANAEALRERRIEEKDLPLAQEAKVLREGLVALELRFWWPYDTVGIVPDTDILSRLAYVRGYLGSSWARPNATHLEYLRQARGALEAALNDLNAFYGGEVEAFRSRLAGERVELVPSLPPLPPLPAP
jgi:photosystem II stability/assembly factor-like uncharacterized protein